MVANSFHKRKSSLLWLLLQCWHMPQERPNSLIREQVNESGISRLRPPRPGTCVVQSVSWAHTTLAPWKSVKTWEQKMKSLNMVKEIHLNLTFYISSIYIYNCIICMPYANKTTNIFRSTFKIIYTCWRWVMLALILQGEMCITKKYKGETESSDRVSKVSLAEVPSKSIKAVYIQRRAARRTPGLVQPSFSCWSFTYCSGKICRKNSVASSVPLLSLGRLANEVEAWKQCGKIQRVTFHW